MNLIEHYNKLYNDSMLEIRSQNCQIDKLIDSPTDRRFGITLLIRPGFQIKRKIQQFLRDLKIIEPDQYYYPDSDIHITVMSVITCSDGFHLSQISVPDYVEVIMKSIQTAGRFEIELRGITASPSGIMIQGFLKDDTLSDIRDSLRINFKNSGLKQTIDKRYSIRTAHATVVRFREKLARTEEFIKILEHYRNFSFGVFTVDALELVYNDWYQRKKYVKKLHRFDFI